jgi:hypothetical protein
LAAVAAAAERTTAPLADLAGCRFMAEGAVAGRSTLLRLDLELPRRAAAADLKPATLALELPAA